MNQDDNAVLNGRLNKLWRALRILFSACGELFLPIEPEMITNRKNDSHTDQDGEVSEDNSGWVAADPPYYSGKFNVWSSGLTILGSGLFGSSWGMLSSDRWAWMFPGMLFGGIAFIILGWILMGVHTKCETVKFAKVKDDDLRKERVNRYCKRYKKSAKRYRAQKEQLLAYQYQALKEARPKFLKSNEEFLEAYAVLKEIRIPPMIESGWIENGLWSFLVDASEAHDSLIGVNAILLIGTWMYGEWQYKEMPDGSIRRVNRTPEELKQWKKNNPQPPPPAKTGGREPATPNEVFPPERGI